MRRRAGSAAHVRDTTVLCLTIGLTIAVESFSSVSAASAALIPPRHPRLCAPEPLATGAGGPAVPGGRTGSLPSRPLPRVCGRIAARCSPAPQTTLGPTRRR